MFGGFHNSISVRGNFFCHLISKKATLHEQSSCRGDNYSGAGGFRYINGSLDEWLIQLVKTDAQLLDDSGMSATDDQSRMTCGRSLMAVPPIRPLSHEPVTD